MTKFCNKCNYPIEEGGVFCSECGSSDIRDSYAPQPSTSAEENITESSPSPDVVSTPENTIPISNPVGENSPIPEINPSVDSNDNVMVQNAPVQSSDINPSVDSNDNIMVQNAPVQSFDANPTSHNESSNDPTIMVGSPNISIMDIPKGFRPDDSDDAHANAKSLVDLSKEGNASIARKRKVVRRKQGAGKFVFFLLGVGFCAVVGFLLLYVFFFGDTLFIFDGKAVESGPFKTDDLRSAGSNTPAVDYSTIFTPENSFRVGDSRYGYFSIPNTWVNFSDVNANGTLQYTDDGTWIVTMYGVPTNQLSAADWANNVYNNLKQANVKNLTASISSINSYPAFTVSAYYAIEQKYLTTWFLESRVGNTHYLAIEGPSASGDNYNIIYSFKEDK